MYLIAHLTASELPSWLVVLLVGVTLGAGLALAFWRQTER